MNCAPPNVRIGARWAVAATVFFLLRVAGSTAAFFLFGQSQQAELAVLPHIPRGAAVFTLVDQSGWTRWDNPRLMHIDGFAIARRRAFTNGQWTIPGQQLVRARHAAAAPYVADPSQLIYPPGSHEPFPGFDPAIAKFDRGTFGYVWTVGFAPGRPHARDLAQVWTNGSSTLYRVIDHP